MGKLINWIKKNKIIVLLFIVNFASTLVAFNISNATPFPDSQEYWLAAEGLANGNFSSWYFLDSYYPETLRTPGYSLFLLIFKSIYDSQFFVKLIQFALYAISLIIAFKIVSKLSGQSKLATTIFLSFTAINIQIPFYTGYIASEIPCVFLVILYLYILFTKDKKSVKNAILLGLVGGSLFIIRPSFMLFPFFLTIYILFFDRSSLKYIAIHLMIFVLTLMPFSIWNYNAHGTFKPTPIDGAIGAAHLGYWFYKLPIGYQEKFHWGNVVVSDLTNPISYSDEEREKYKIEYETEWKQLLESQDHLLSENDLVNIEIMKSDTTPNIFLLHNSEFTIKRSENLKKLLIKNIKQNPWYYAKTRIYTFFRVYYTGINKVKYISQTSILGKIKILYPFLITFVFILLGLLFNLFYILIKKGKVKKEYIILLLISLYQGMAYTPFTIQSRYTIPVHFCVLILTSLILSDLFKLRNSKNKL